MSFFYLFMKKKVLKKSIEIREDHNIQRAKAIIRKYAFDFSNISKEEIKQLLEQEINFTQPGSAEYIRVLCGYLYCVGDETDVPLLEKAKFSINMDIGTMIDSEWIDSLKTKNVEDDDKQVRPREQIVADFISYYERF